MSYQMTPMSGGSSVAIAGDELLIDGNEMLLPGSTLTCGGVASDSAGCIQVNSATMNVAGPAYDPNMRIVLEGSAHLNIQSKMQFLSPITLTSLASTIDVEGIKGFVKEAYNAATDVVSLLGKNNVVLDSLHVIDQVVNTTLQGTVYTGHGSYDGVILSLHHT